MDGLSVASVIANFFKDKVDSVFMVTGGGAMYLNDAFARAYQSKLIFMHHEQSLSMAAEAYARFNGLSVCQVTTGPGGINSLAGCAGAFIDSQPVFFVSGQVESYSLGANGIRQFGVQEIDICSIVKPIVKEVIQLNDPNMILYELDRLHFAAITGRPGPVWLDIPLDIQNVKVDVDSLPRFVRPKPDRRLERMFKSKIERAVEICEKCTRPVLLIGAGCRNFLEAHERFLSELSVPIISGWNGKDLVDHNDALYLGSCGIFGNRIANLAVNQADLIIGVGYRFSVPQVGYDPSGFAPNAKKICVDIDPVEFIKNDSIFDLTIRADAGEFFREFPLDKLRSEADWIADLVTFKGKFGLDEMYNWAYVDKPQNVNSFEFINILSETLPEAVRVVTDMGTSFTCTHQVLHLRRSQKLFTSSGLASMGFGLPGAIGSAQSTDDMVVLITGDGGLMFNLQELEVLSNVGSNLRIIVLNNDGYLTMKHMQKARFNLLVGSNPSTGITMPNFCDVANTFRLEYKLCKESVEIQQSLTWLLSKDGPKTRMLEVIMDPEQPLIPRVQTRTDGEGKLIPPTLADVFPFV